MANMVNMMVARAEAEHSRRGMVGEYARPVRRSHHGAGGEDESVLLEWEARLPLPVARTRVDLGEGRGIWIDAEPAAVVARLEAEMKRRRTGAVVYVSAPVPGSRTVELKIMPLAVRQDRVRQENRESVARAQRAFLAHVKAGRRTDPEVRGMFLWVGGRVTAPGPDAPEVPTLVDLILGRAALCEERPLRSTALRSEPGARARKALAG